jgi:sugar phosphate isomerase/epimerase
VRFGLSTHLFHGERLTREHLLTIRANGFDLIEVFATRTHVDYRNPARVDELRGWLDELSITAGSMHAPICESFVGGVWGRAFSNASTAASSREEAVAETTAAIEAAVRLGCGVVVLHLGLPRGQKIPPGDNDARAMRRSLESVVAAADTAGIKLALEVIPNDLSTPDALLGLLGGDLELGSTGVCLDFGHAHILGGAPEAAEALSGHVITTHVHDNDGRDDIHLVPFQGTIDWPMTLMAMWKIGYQGPLVFEVADHGDAARVLARTVGARSRLQAILKDLAEPIVFSEGASEPS